MASNHPDRPLHLVFLAIGLIAVGAVLFLQCAVGIDVLNIGVTTDISGVDR